MTNIQALKLKGKPQHMIAGKVYEVTEEMSKVLIKGKSAKLADKNMKVGEVYPLEDKKVKSKSE